MTMEQPQVGLLLLLLLQRYTVFIAKDVNRMLSLL